MAEWVADVNAIPGERVPIAEGVARRHAAFGRIHPFLDGNGRTGRLLANLIFLRLGYPPAFIPERERLLYLEALQSAALGDCRPLGELFARALLESCRQMRSRAADSAHQC